MVLNAKRVVRVAVWLAALCGGAIAANADSVLFSTASTSVTGTNGSNTEGTVNFTGTTAGLGDYTYNPAAPSTTISNVFFGNFSAVDGSDNKGLNDLPISIVLTESAPGAGTGDFAATLSGKLKSTGSTVTATFDTTSFDILDSAAGLDVKYSLNVGTLQFVTSSLTNPTFKALEGTITVTSSPSGNPLGALPSAPLPASFSSGLGVLGLLAGAAYFRRRHRTLA